MDEEAVLAQFIATLECASQHGTWWTELSPCSNLCSIVPRSEEVRRLNPENAEEKAKKQRKKEMTDFLNSMFQ